MTGVRVLVAVLSLVMLVALPACNSDDSTGGAGTSSAFRNLGKRSDTNLGNARGATTR
jgi:hypothetical protein